MDPTDYWILDDIERGNQERKEALDNLITKLKKDEFKCSAVVPDELAIRSITR